MTLIKRRSPIHWLDLLQDEAQRAWDMQKSSLLDDDDDNNLEMSRWSPAVDVKEEDHQFVVIADIPGVDAKDVNISVEKGALIIRGERHSEFSAEKAGIKRKERHDGVFYRRFMLPESADIDNINAKSKHGVYTITIPKRNGSTNRRIEVESH